MRFNSSEFFHIRRIGEGLFIAVGNEREASAKDGGGSGEQGTVTSLELSTIVRNIIQRIKGARVRERTVSFFLYTVFHLTGPPSHDRDSSKPRFRGCALKNIFIRPRTKLNYLMAKTAQRS